MAATALAISVATYLSIGIGIERHNEYFGRRSAFVRISNVILWPLAAIFN